MQLFKSPVSFVAPKDCPHVLNKVDVEESRHANAGTDVYISMAMYMS